MLTSVPQRVNTETEEIDRRELKFRDFNAKNPDIYNDLVELAREVKASGKNKIGIDMLYGQLRWNKFIENEEGTSHFKLNSMFAPYYARLIMKQEPDLAGLFNIRKSCHHPDGTEFDKLDAIDEDLIYPEIKEKREIGKDY
jgi:hypothetical protein